METLDELMMRAEKEVAALEKEVAPYAREQREKLEFLTRRVERLEKLYEASRHLPENIKLWPTEPEKPIYITTGSADGKTELHVSTHTPPEIKKSAAPSLLNGKTPIQACISEWEATLRHFGVNRTLRVGEDLLLSRAIYKHGHDDTILALIGCRYEQKTKSFDPAKCLSLDRIFRPTLFDKFVNLGCQKRDGTLSSDTGSKGLDEFLKEEK
jgi:hypothetical protein